LIPEARDTDIDKILASDQTQSGKVKKVTDRQSSAIFSRRISNCKWMQSTRGQIIHTKRTFSIFTEVVCGPNVGFEKRNAANKKH